MDSHREHQLNQDAFRRLKEAIAQTYPPGRFVAIAGGQIIADSERFDELRSLLMILGKDPTEVLVVRTGEEYPETAVIFHSW